MSEQSTGEIEEHAGSDGEHSGEVEHGELVEPVGDVAGERPFKGAWPACNES